MRIAAASLLLVACATTSHRPRPRRVEVTSVPSDCGQTCDDPGDVASCHTECKRQIPQSCADVCREAPVDERASCVAHCERPRPLFLCGTPYVRTKLNRADTIALVVIGAAMVGIFGSVAYVTHDWLSYQ